jgi:hypothetical protein
MKSLTKTDWLLASFMATQHAREFLEQPPASSKATACLKHFSYPALVKARAQLCDRMGLHELSGFCHEVHAVDTRLVSVADEIGVIEVKGCLLCYRLLASHADLLLSSVFRLRLTCRCHRCLRSENSGLTFGRSTENIIIPETIPAVKQALQESRHLDVQITDFDYETLY